MTVELTYDVPPRESPESRMFTYPTRLADVWVPRIETVVEDACTSEAARLTFRIERGSTSSLAIPNWTRHPLRRARRLLAPIDLGDALVMDSRWDGSRNYCLFILNVAQRALLLRNLLHEQGQDDASLVVLLPTKAPIGFREVLDALSIRWIATDAEARGRVVSQTLKPAPMASFTFLPDLFPALSERDGIAPERVFINRREGRVLVNESEVVNFLQSRGFHTCTFEGMPVRRQWAMLRQAKEVVAIHGAGITNMLFNRLWETGEGPKMVEVFPASYRILWFRHLISTLRGRWCAVRSQITPEVVKDLDERGLAMKRLQDPIRVHVDSLAAALDYLR